MPKICPVHVAFPTELRKSVLKGRASSENSFNFMTILLYYVFQEQGNLKYEGHQQTRQITTILSFSSTATQGK